MQRKLIIEEFLSAQNVAKFILKSSLLLLSLSKFPSAHNYCWNTHHCSFLALRPGLHRMRMLAAAQSLVSNDKNVYSSINNHLYSSGLNTILNRKFPKVSLKLYSNVVYKFLNIFPSGLVFAMFKVVTLRVFQMRVYHTLQCQTSESCYT